MRGSYPLLAQTLIFHFQIKLTGLVAKEKRVVLPGASSSTQGMEGFQLAPSWSYHKNLTRALCMTNEGNLIIHRIYGCTLWQCIILANERYRNPQMGIFWPGFSNVRPHNTVDPPLFKVDSTGTIWLDGSERLNHLYWVNSIGKDVLVGLFDGMC